MVTDHPAHDPLHGHIPVETVQGHFGGQFRPHGFKGCCHIDMGLGADESVHFSEGFLPVAVRGLVKSLFDVPRIDGRQGQEHRGDAVVPAQFLDLPQIAVHFFRVRPVPETVAAPP